MSKPKTIKILSGEVQCNTAMCKFFKIIKKKKQVYEGNLDIPPARCILKDKNINFNNGYKAICKGK